MLHSGVGVYRDSRIELIESPGEITNETRVIVTFLEPSPLDLRDRNIDQAQAAMLRDRLASFAEDWDDPSMSIYDDYDAAKSEL